MIWPPSTVRAIRGLWSELEVSEEALSRNRAATLDMIARRLWGKLDEMAHSWAVDLQLEDIQVWDYKTDEVSPNCLAFRGGWLPRTTQMEFHGGPLQGQTMSRPMTMMHEPLMARVADSPVSQFYSADEKYATLPIQHVEYRYDGWNEKTRKWAFRALVDK